MQNLSLKGLYYLFIYYPNNMIEKKNNLSNNKVLDSEYFIFYYYCSHVMQLFITSKHNETTAFICR